MGKIIKLTESDIIKLVREIINQSLLINEISDYDMSMIVNGGGKILDKLTIEGYELSLIDFGDSGKTISLTYNDKGFFKPNQQDKQKSDYNKSDVYGIFRKLISKVQDWVNRYGVIIVGSTNEERVKKYHKWLCPGLKCSNTQPFGKLPHGETQYGFVIQR